MKIFKDLEFKPHSIGGDHTQATMDFSNGYGVSVITGSKFYTDRLHPYEVGVTWHGGLTYNTPITDDVIGHCNKASVTKIMKRVQSLPKL